MDIIVTKIWASPSTLHIRVMVESKRRRWSQFCWVRVPLSEIPTEVARLIALSAENDRDQEPVDDPLW